MAMDRDDDRPAKKPEVPIGDDLALLSVEELEWRIGVLRQEIMRLEAAITAKRASRSAADSVFKL
ncbi:MAG TPA: DUF1192 domain-containing protein [Aestuariivirgaceae bacterium]|jgi:uncharacterized small protein (DUF1192 family)|nr:DUF1192 domain-containing protein [Aestuariivirgaceae bacterium]